MSGKKPKNSKKRHFSPIFGDKLVNWNMKSRAVDKMGFGVNTQLKMAEYPIILKTVGNKTQLK